MEVLKKWRCKDLGTNVPTSSIARVSAQAGIGRGNANISRDMRIFKRLRAVRNVGNSLESEMSMKQDQLDVGCTLPYVMLLWNLLSAMTHSSSILSYCTTTVVPVPFLPKVRTIGSFETRA